MARPLLVFPTVIPANLIGQGLDVPNSTRIRRHREAFGHAAARALAFFVSGTFTMGIRVVFP